jgi:hypothetical protein
MRSYIDNRGVYHRFIDWAKLFGRKKDTEETAEEAAEIQEPVDTPQCLDDTDNAAPTVSDECNDDCPLEERVDDALLDGEPVDECNDDCPCEGPYVYEEPITIAEEVVEPQGVVETSTESVLLEEDLKEEMPVEMPVDKKNTVKSKKSEKVVKEKSTAKKTTTKKTTTKSSKSKK